MKRLSQAVIVGFMLQIMVLAQEAGATIVPPQKASITLQDIIEFNSPSEVTISPDGYWVAYVLEKASIQDNAYARHIFVVPTNGSASPRPIGTTLPGSGEWVVAQSLSLVWSPASDKVAYVARRNNKGELREIDLKTGADTAIEIALNRSPPFVSNVAQDPVGYDPANANPVGRFVAVALRKKW